MLHDGYEHYMFMLHDGYEHNTFMLRDGSEHNMFMLREGYEHRRPEPPPPLWNLKMMTSYAVPVENTLKFSLAPSAITSNTLKDTKTKFKPHFSFALLNYFRTNQYDEP